MIYTVYTVRDQDMGVRYVGCTSQGTKARLRALANGKQDVSEWIRSELASGRKVSIVPEECFDASIYEYGETGAYIYAQSAERDYIRGYHRLLGDKLLNRTNVPLPRSDSNLAVSDINGLLHKESA